MLTSADVALSAGGNGIGSATSAIQINAPLLSANSTGNVYLASQNANATLQDSSGGNQFQITSAGNLTVNAAAFSNGISAANILISTTNNGNITLDAPLGGLGGTLGYHGHAHSDRDRIDI